MRIWTLFLALTLFAGNALSAELKLNYSLFFGYMKTLYKLDYEHVTTAFYLLDKETGEPCQISNAEMVVDAKREKIDFDEIGRLKPFFSDQHRKDGAMIEVSLLDPELNKHCDLSVSLMAKEKELNALSYQKMLVISTELEGVLRKNAGMIAKYFLPTFQGIRIEPKQALTESQMKNLKTDIKIDEKGDLLISNKVLSSFEQTALFNVQVKKITPWILVD